MSIFKVLVKIVYAGSYLVVPSGKTWQIERLFLSVDNGYNILVDKNNLKPIYSAGDTILLPYYIVEMELLGKDNSPKYHLEINETD